MVGMIHEYKAVSQYCAPLNSSLIDASLANAGIKLNLGDGELTDLIEWLTDKRNYAEGEEGFTATITHATAQKYGAKYAEEQIMKLFMLAANEKARELGVVLEVTFFGYKLKEDSNIYAIIGWIGACE